MGFLGNRDGYFASKNFNRYATHASNRLRRGEREFASALSPFAESEQTANTYLNNVLSGDMDITEVPGIGVNTDEINRLLANQFQASGKALSGQRIQAALDRATGARQQGFNMLANYAAPRITGQIAGNRQNVLNQISNISLQKGGAKAAGIVADGRSRDQGIANAIQLAPMVLPAVAGAAKGILGATGLFPGANQMNFNPVASPTGSNGFPGLNLRPNYDTPNLLR